MTVKIVILIGIFVVIGISIVVGNNYRKYKNVDGKAYVKHGILGRWEPLDEHIEKEHKGRSK